MRGPRKIVPQSEEKKKVTVELERVAWYTNTSVPDLTTWQIDNIIPNFRWYVYRIEKVLDTWCFYGNEEDDPDKTEFKQT